ncbi:MAG: Hsp20/alpha crystallin family protein [Acidimicrobiales bacterium]
MQTQQPTHAEVVDATADLEATMRAQAVPVNVYEASEALVVVAPLPAVQAQDVTVELRSGTLRFWAHLRSAAPREYLVHEWEYGGYEREIDVPDGFGGGVEASLANGQLVVRVLRGEGTEPQTCSPTAL